MLSVTVIVCVWGAAALPHASTRFQVLVIIFEPAHWPLATLSVNVACNSAEQLSASLVTSPVAVTEASKVQSAVVNISVFAGAVKVGAIVSWIVNVAEDVAALSQASVAVNITVTAAEQSFEITLKLLDQVTPEQLSDATAPPLESNHVWSSSVLPLPLHSTIIFAAAVVKVGAVVSSMVNEAVDVEVLPESSVAVNITVALPVLPQPSLNPLKLLDQVMLEQVSEAVAPPWLDNQACNAVVLPLPSHCSVRLLASVITGGVVSITFIITVAWAQILGTNTLQIWYVYV